jgi:hypothetical protein
MEQWIRQGENSGGAGGSLLVGLVVLLITLPPWVVVLFLWRAYRNLLEEHRAQIKLHTNDLLQQSERFSQQYYNQGERSSLVLSDSLRRVTESFAKAVSGMPED